MDQQPQTKNNPPPSVVFGNLEKFLAATDLKESWALSQPVDLDGLDIDRKEKATLALHFAFYHFCRVHETLRVTPAMEMGLTNHIWSVAELIEMARTTPPRTPPPVAKTAGPRLRVIQGGKAA